MTAPISNHDSLITRRSILIGAGSLLCAPAIVRAASLMPVRRPLPPFGPQYAGFVDRLYFHTLDGSLRAELRAGQTSIHFNGTIIPVAKAQRLVAHAQVMDGYHLTFPHTEMIEERRMVAYAREQGWIAPEQHRYEFSKTICRSAPQPTSEIHDSARTPYWCFAANSATGRPLRPRARGGEGNGVD